MCPWEIGTPIFHHGTAEERTGARCLDHPGRVVAGFAATRSTYTFQLRERCGIGIGVVGGCLIFFGGIYQLIGV